MNFLKTLFSKKPRIQKVNLARRFDLIGRVGQGSMSKVWRATDTMTGRTVALKVLDPSKTRRLEARFVGLNRPSEGTVAIQLKHPNIVQTIEHGLSTDNAQFLVMEFIEGVSLSYLVDVQNQVMRENRLRLIIQFGAAIEYFHRQNFIHRDLCPRNVLLDKFYQVKLIDFGLAVPNTPPFRKPGNRTGTVSYMAPELIKRQPTDQRIDIFSFAVSCYEMFTKRHPWDAGETIDTVLQHINKPPEDIRVLTPEIDEQVADTIMRGLERHPADRWQKIGEMLAEFRDARRRLEGVEGEDADKDDDEYEEVTEYIE